MTTSAQDKATQALIARACAYLRDNLAQAPTLEALGAHLHISPYHLQRTFKRLMRVSPRQYVEALRLEALKARLRAGDNVTEALYAVGYGSSSRLYEKANITLGMTPSTYGKKGAGMVIVYTISPCHAEALDATYMLLAATERGICAVRLGDSEDVLEAELQAEFSRAMIGRDDEALAQWVAHIQHYIAGEQGQIEMPLDVRATAFQAQVWEALRNIPYGETRTYSDIANAIGQPQAARAVARAIASNPVALVIPCHRVVRKDGKMGGYRWGTRRKAQLLALEQSKAQKD